MFVLMSLLEKSVLNSQERVYQVGKGVWEAWNCIEAMIANTVKTVALSSEGEQLREVATGKTPSEPSNLHEVSKKKDEVRITVLNPFTVRSTEACVL